jgi:hypothetical protein
MINSVTVSYNTQNVTSSMLISPINTNSKNLSVDRLLVGRSYTINITVTEPGRGQRIVSIPANLATVPPTTVVLNPTPVAITTPLRGGKRKTRKIKKSRKSRK